MAAHWFDQFCEKRKVHLYLPTLLAGGISPPLRMCVEKFPESCNESLELFVGF